MNNDFSLEGLDGEKLYLELIKHHASMNDEEIALYILKLDGRFLYEAGKNIHKISNETKKKAFRKLEGKYIVEAMKTWKGISKEEKKESLTRLSDDGRLYAQALKILEH